MKLFKTLFSRLAGCIMFIGVVFLMVIFGVVATAFSIIWQFIQLGHEDYVKDPFEKIIDSSIGFMRAYYEMVHNIYLGGLFEQKQ